MESETIKNLKDSLLDIQEQIQAMEAHAEAEGRDLTEDEDREMRSLFSQFDAVSEQIERKERIEAQRAKLAQSVGRQTEPNPTEPQNAIDHEPAPQNSRRRAILEPQFTRDKGKWGWKNMGEYAIAIRQAARQGGQLDPRLVMNAPTTYSSEGVGADGGFAVPPDFRQEIWQKVNGEDSLLAMTDQNPTSKNTIVFPADETTPWDSSGGIQAYFESEAGQLTQSKVALQDKTIRLNKLTALIPVTEELMEDAPGLDGYLRKKVGEKFDFKLNLKFVQGTGAGEPLGILNAASLVSVGAESGQSADTVVAENIMNMWVRLYAPCRRNAIWLINQDIEAQLMQMVIQGTNSGVFPVYMPPSGLSAAPYGTLMGRPVFPTQACETLGDKGDIILVDLKQYMTAVKTGNVRADVSMHLWFDYDVLAYRFILRIAGQPWWAAYITPRDSSNYISWAVTLDARA
jgi:HK97 family phage major capsid protein